jgi:CheY-like chemotaxis protein
VRVPQKVRKTEWRVVLAEDDYDYAIVIERALEKAAGVPVEIRRARTGLEALVLLRDVVPDLLLLDLKMPGMAGHEILEEIKGDDALRSIPVAILTSSDRDHDVAKSYGLGGNHFITKPSNPLELEEKLGALLRNLTELGAIRRGSTGATTTAVSAVDPRSMAVVKVLRWVAVVGVLVALAIFGRVSGVF